MNIVSATLLVVLATVGAAAVIRELCYSIFRYRDDNLIIFVTPEGESCNAEILLRSAAARIDRDIRGKRQFIICPDCEMDDETQKICEAMCRDYGFSRLITREEFYELIKEKR